MTSSIELRVSNYRCFTDSKPLVLPVSSRIVGLVGENNAGKSTALRMIRELKPLWHELRDVGNVCRLLHGGENKGIGSAQDTLDPTEIFCDRNSRDILLVFNIAGPSQNAEFRIHVRRANNFSLELLQSHNGKRLQFRPNDYDYSTESFVGGGINVPVPGLFSMIERFVASLYLPSFRNTVNTGGGTLYGLPMGSAFIQAWSEWKTGADKSKNRAISNTTELIRQAFGFENLEINAMSTSNDMQVVIDRRPYRLNEVGAGIAQFIMTLGHVTLAKPQLTLIDEPELGLHPRIQTDLLRILCNLSGGWLYFATHSLGLARTFAESNIAFRRQGDAPEVKPLQSIKNVSEFLGELSFSGRQDLGCSKILLVEGTSDVRVAMEFLRKLGKGHEVVCLPLGGSSLISSSSGMEMAELQRFNCDVFALIDSEKKSESTALAKSRQDFGDCCTSLGFKTLITSRRAIENYFTDDAVKAALGPSYRALSQFERVQDATPSWGKQDNARIAEKQDFGLIEKTDLGEFFTAI